MLLNFKDEGCEISSEQLKNIYNPLHSSKKDGVGLGLSTVYQIVNENSFLKFLAWAYDGSFYIEMRTSLQKNTPVIKYAARNFIRNL
jgi:nitrogen-specific signal transduction histidine kinase